MHYDLFLHTIVWGMGRWHVTTSGHGGVSARRCVVADEAWLSSSDAAPASQAGSPGSEIYTIPVVSPSPLAVGLRDGGVVN